MSIPNVNTYQDYLDTSKSPYRMTEDQFNKQKQEEANRGPFQKVYHTVFDVFEKMLPENHKAIAPWTEMSLTVISYEIKSRPKTTACVATAAAVSLVVFFYPSLMPSSQFQQSFQFFCSVFTKDLYFKGDK